jgi:hypothetical protein
MQARKEREDKLKWVIAAGGLAFFGYAVWQYLDEAAKAARATQRKREPWEMV